jgi:hypothetical protein
MRLPYLQANAGQLIELAWYVICGVNADPETKGMAAQLAAVRMILKQRLGARNDAADDVVEARAIRAMALLLISRWLKQLSLDATAAFAGKKQSPDYVRILPMSPSKMLGQSAAARMDSIAKVIKALAHPATPKSLHPAGEKGKLLLANLAQHEAHVTAQRAVWSDRLDDVNVARKQWFTAYKSLHSALKLKFPDDEDRVDAYFDQPPTAKGQSVEAAGTAVVDEPEVEDKTGQPGEVA